MERLAAIVNGLALRDGVAAGAGVPGIVHPMPGSWLAGTAELDGSELPART